MTEQLKVLKRTDRNAQEPPAAAWELAPILTLLVPHAQWRVRPLHLAGSKASRAVPSHVAMLCLVTWPVLKHVPVGRWCPL